MNKNIKVVMVEEDWNIVEEILEEMLCEEDSERILTAIRDAIAAADKSA
jgi:hypothetical protein